MPTTLPSTLPSYGTPTSDDASGDIGDGTSINEQPSLPTASPTPVGVDDTVDATSGSGDGRDGGAGLSGGAIAGIVVGTLVLAIAAMMWVRGTPTPCTEKGNPHGNGQTTARPTPMYSNPAYVGGADLAAMGRRDSVA